MKLQKEKYNFDKNFTRMIGIQSGTYNASKKIRIAILGLGGAGGYFGGLLAGKYFSSDEIEMINSVLKEHGL